MNSGANRLKKILEMDDDEEERDFSTSIVFDFFDQAKVTFKNLDKALYISLSLHVDFLRVLDLLTSCAYSAYTDILSARKRILNSCQPWDTT
jgi:hypothetical protein